MYGALVVIPGGERRPDRLIGSSQKIRKRRADKRSATDSVGATLAWRAGVAPLLTYAARSVAVSTPLAGLFRYGSGAGPRGRIKAVRDATMERRMRQSGRRCANPQNSES
jgi:hypothetical protein